MIHFKNDTFRCTSEIVLKLVSGKWKLAILYALSSTSSMRFNEIQKLLPEATQRVLTLQLRDLEHDLLVIRKVYPVIPPKVEYSLSELGLEMVPLLNILCDFGTTYISSPLHQDLDTRANTN